MAETGPFWLALGISWVAPVDSGQFWRLALVESDLIHRLHWTKYKVFH